jgi:hypothetical protein
MRKIFAICGFAGSGKDTLADFLVENRGYTKLSFASLLKDVVSVLFSWDREMLEGKTEASREWRETVDTWWETKLQIKGLTPRMILQTIGTDVLRNHFNEDIWVIAIERKILQSKYNKIVITDCRFPNEYIMLKELGSKFVCVCRNELPDWGIDFLNRGTKPKNIHESEYLWLNFDFDYIIENVGTVENFKKDILSTFK